MNYESYYMTEEEFYLLLAGKGVDRWYGMTSDPEGIRIDAFDTKGIYWNLIKLYQKKLVSWEQEMVKVEGAASEMLDILLASQCCVRLQTEESQEESVFYLAGERAVELEMSRRESRTFRVTILQLADLEFILEERGIYRKESTFEDEPERIIGESELDRGLKLASLLFVNPRNGQEIKRMVLTEEGADLFLNVSWKDRYRRIPFRMELWKKEFMY